MIYLFYIVNPAGILVWSYRYPRLPKELIEHLAKYGEDNFDSILSSAVRALWTVGREISGIDLKEVDYGPFYLYLANRKINGRELLFIMLADSKDNSKLLAKILEKFINKNQQTIAKLTSLRDEITEEHSQEMAKYSMELESSLTDILNDHISIIEAIGRKDFSSFIMSFILGMITYAIAIGLTYLVNRAYHYIPERNFIPLFAIIVALDFLIPGLIVGLLAGSFRNAMASSIIIAPAVLSALSLIWWDDLVSISEYFFGITEPTIISIGIILAGFVVGAALGMVAGIVAYLFSEMKWLSPPREYMRPRESKKEQFIVGVRSIVEAIKALGERFKK